tara:strand:+ start:293 stop:508 length:216 start_codon:yes stop_codon:yes gene_type:complete
MTQSYSQTTFNVPLTGQQIMDINFFRSYFKLNNPSYFDITLPDYEQEFIDDWQKVDNVLKNTSKVYDRSFS